MAGEPLELDLLTYDEAAQEAAAIAQASRNARWPEHLAEMLDVTNAALRHEVGEERAEEIARRVVVAQARHIGGRAFYFPTGESLELAMRDDAIFRAARRGNTEALARQYSLTPRSIERIVRQQTLLHKDRMQPRLPFADR